MAENNGKEKSGFTLDWLVRGVLTKTGDTLDRLTGRGWKPSSSLATSELIERLKALLDSEARDEGEGRIYVPHNIKLKMQWDKFSTDSEDSLKALETELLTAAVDHINDRRYYTHAPLQLEIKPDYFTSGVVLLVSFERSPHDEREVAVNVNSPGEVIAHSAAEEVPTQPQESVYVASFSLDGEERRVRLRFSRGTRLSVGRTKENDLAISDASVSKIHASLALNSENNLIVSDTGSTNGTFIDGQRIAYGKTAVVENGQAVVFGTIKVNFERSSAAEQADTVPQLEAPTNDADLPFMNTRVEFVKAIPTGSHEIDDLPAEETPRRSEEPAN
jgi:hypothetical protein